MKIAYVLGDFVRETGMLAEGCGHGLEKFHKFLAILEFSSTTEKFHEKNHLFLLLLFLLYIIFLRCRSTKPKTLP